MTRLNEEIKSTKILLVEKDTTKTYNLLDALALAKSKNLDLVEIAVKEDTSVCKLIDHKKYLYEQKKAKKKVKKKEMKTVKFSIDISDNDFYRKIKECNRFLDKGLKVKVTLSFNGRRGRINDTERRTQEIAKGLEKIEIIKENLTYKNCQDSSNLTTPILIFIFTPNN